MSAAVRLETLVLALGERKVLELVKLGAERDPKLSTAEKKIVGAK